MDKRIKPGVLIRAHRNGRNDHGFKSGQLVRVVEVYDDEIVAHGVFMGMAYGAANSTGAFNWGTGRGSMFLYPGEYKFAKQANKREGK